MINLQDTVTVISSILLCLGILAGGIGYLVSIFRKSNKQENVEVVTTANQLTEFWKDQIQGFKVMVEDQNKKIQDLSNELNLVKGQLMEKDKQIKTYLEILQNRNPEMEEFMKYMVQSVKDQGESHKQIVDVLKEIHDFARLEHERDFNITATVTKN